MVLHLIIIAKTRIKNYCLPQKLKVFFLLIQSSSSSKKPKCNSPVSQSSAVVSDSLVIKCPRNRTSSRRNRSRADERIPILIDLPFMHKGLHIAPMLGPIKLGKYLDCGQIEQVACGGENYSGRRECDYSWVKEIQEECVKRNITFCYMETGTTFIKDGRKYIIKSKQEQNLQAFKSGLTYVGKPIDFKLYDSDGSLLPEDMLYIPRFSKKIPSLLF